MGTWSASPFKNDGALDWVWSLEGVEDTSVLSEALDAVAADDFDEGCEEAVAAAEVVAALRGKPLPELPDEVVAYVKALAGKKPAQELVDQAAAVARRIATDSDLKLRWDESESATEWQAAMTDLLKRLGG
jgi:hypothetical protein